MGYLINPQLLRFHNLLGKYNKGGKNMSCGSDYETQNCVCDTLLAILEAQDRVAPEDGATGCDRAIKEMTCGVSTSGYNAVPIILTLKYTGKPFVGIGAVRENVSPSTCSFIYSPIFRVDNVDPDTCCASLELLKKSKMPHLVDGDVPSDGVALYDLCNEVLEGTDSYITVDLSIFGAVTCLSPTTI